MPTNIGGVALGDLVLGAGSSVVNNETVTSTLTFTQSISHTIEALVQTITFTQDISFTRAFNRTVTSTLSLSGTIHVIVPETVTSTITFSQTIDETKTKPREVDQTLSLAQDIVSSHIAAELIVSGLEFTHTRDYDAVFNRSISESLAFNQTIAADHCTTASNTLVLTQTISYEKWKHIGHTLEWQQSLVNNTNFVRPINTILGVSQQVVENGKFNKTIGQNLALSQTIVQARVKGVSQTLSLSQSIVAYAARHVANSLSFSQTIGVQMLYDKTVQQTLNLESDILLNRATSHEIHHGIGFNSIIGKQKVMFESLTDNYVPTAQVRFNVYSRTVNQTLSLGQTVAYTPVYPRAVSNSLQFNQTIGLSRTIVESVTSTLAFLPARQVYVGMGGVEYYSVDNLQYSLVPAYLVGKKNRPMCVLQTNNAAITLPAPEFGDQENYDGVFTIRRSMNNIPYTHVRTLSLRQLKLPFVLAKRKAWELREFLLANNTELMTLTTWKGDKWFVNLTTNPLELRVSGRYANEDEKVSVELEFEGLKVM